MNGLGLDLINELPDVKVNRWFLLPHALSLFHSLLPCCSLYEITFPLHLGNLLATFVPFALFAVKYFFAHLSDS